MWLQLYKPLLAGCAFLCLAGAAHGQPDVPPGEDLQRDGRLALELQLPILLEFSAVNCMYCRQLEQEFLIPMLISGEYTDKVMLRRLRLDTGVYLTDFDGRRKPASDVASRYRAWVTPTLVFMDGHGNEITERMVGINTPELFGAYLDACIDTALLKIREPGSRVTIPGCTAIDAP